MMSIENATRKYGTQGLHDFQAWYANYHGYASIVVCVFGVVTSIFNIIVLTRKNMRNTTNYILTALAVSDMLTMASYIPFALQFYVLHGQFPTPERNTQPWAMFFNFHVNFTVTTHTTSIWLGVILSLFRYAYIKVANQGSNKFGPNNTLLAILLVYVISIIILIPNYLSLTIITRPFNGTNETIYDIDSIPTDDRYGQIITGLNFWIHALVIKLIPCALLTIFGILLICTLRVSNKRRKKLQKQKKAKSKLVKSRDRDHSRTTCMLVVVVVLFLITELPQGILALFSGLLPGFFDAFYMPLGDLMDIIALINNAVNFILYCSMSKQFRDTFLGLFCWPCLPPEKRLNFNGQTNPEYTLHSAAQNMFFTRLQNGFKGLTVKTDQARSRTPSPRPRRQQKQPDDVVPLKQPQQLIEKPQQQPLQISEQNVTDESDKLLPAPERLSLQGSTSERLLLEYAQQPLHEHFETANV